MARHANPQPLKRCTAAGAEHKGTGPSPGRNLQSCEQLSRRIADWGEIPSYDAHLAAIRQNHARKSGFWKRMQDIGMAQSG